jgi:tetratricopeptide (TPR) repeat protein
LASFNIYRGDPVALAEQAIAEAPEFVMAYLFKASLFALATEPEATREACTIMDAAKALPMNDRERSFAAALTHLLTGNWTAAAVSLDRHNADYPCDLAALQCGHLIDFYRANARNLRDRIGRVMPHWSPNLAGYGIVQGLYSFGLEEMGEYAKAEDMGRSAIDREPLDCWAHHAVAHVMEMQGRAQDGVGWMIAREPHWSGDDNFFRVHNWWHCSLFYLDLGQIDEVLRLYDSQIRLGQSEVALDMVDASALLWRLELTGQDVGDRWIELANAWDQHTDGKLYPFNDLHGVMAYLGAGRIDQVDRILAAFNNNDSAAPESTIWARQTGSLLVEGFKVFHQGDYATAVDRLHGARFIANSFGGSHAQRDVIDWTLTEAAIRGGVGGMAQSMARERVALKPHSPINRSFLRRATAA